MSDRSSANKSCGARLSEEQLLRIERNKQLARERLLARRKRTTQGIIGCSHRSESSPPGEKKCKLGTSTTLHENPTTSSSKTVYINQSSSTFTSSTSTFKTTYGPNFSNCQQTYPHLKSSKHSDSTQASTSASTSHAILNPQLPETRISAPSKISVNEFHQHLQSKKRIKATFVMISKDLFEVEVPYDAAIITLFKNMNSRSYGMLAGLVEFVYFVIEQ